jgi:hypothetical protein
VSSITSIIKKNKANKQKSTKEVQKKERLMCAGVIGKGFLEEAELKLNLKDTTEEDRKE